jgi:hypothetical protein
LNWLFPHCYSNFDWFVAVTTLDGGIGVTTVVIATILAGDIICSTHTHPHSLHHHRRNHHLQKVIDHFLEEEDLGNKHFGLNGLWVEDHLQDMLGNLSDSTREPEIVKMSSGLKHALELALNGLK